MAAISRHCIFCLALLAALALLGPARGLAQTGPTPATAPISLPGSTGKTCVQVQVKGEQPSPYNCLNQELQQQVQGVSPASPNMPLSATSPSNEVGTFNKAGVAEQYGSNFGKSVIPYRPAPPVFNNALGPAR